MFNSLSFKTRILVSFAILLSLLLGIAGYNLVNNFKAGQDMGEIDSEFLPFTLLAGQMARDVIQVQQFLTDVSATHDPEGYKDAEAAADDFKQGLIKFREHKANDAREIQKLKAIEADFDKFYADGKRMAAAYLEKGLEAGNLIMEEFDQSSLNLAEKMNQFRDAEVANTTEHVHATTERAHFASTLMWLLSAVTLLSGLVIVLMLIRYLNKQLGIDPKVAKEIAQEIAQGNLSRNIPVPDGDKGSLLFAMQNMQQQLLARINQEAIEKANALRIQKALDNASSSVMMADPDYKIIYINDALRAMFKSAQDDIRMDLKNFDADQLIGSNIDIFHKNPAHQRGMLNKLNTTLRSSFVIGGRHMDFTANPVTDEDGGRIGTVVEWRDRTHEINIENEIQNIVDSVKGGILDKRLNLSDKTGFFQTLCSSINELSGVIENVFNDIASVMQSMSNGDLTGRIDNEYAGVYGNCKDDINTTLTKLTEVFSQIKSSADFIANSAHEIASGNDNLSHRAEQQAANLEQTAASMEELTSTVKENAQNAQNANKVSTNARELAEQGGKVVQSAVVAMQEINDSSNKISAIIGVIDEIAFQTNLLALNASVEAARAGEHGRGFSVVATEVRNLAQRSAAAARESKALIQTSIQKVRVGTDFVNQTGQSLTAIVNGVKEVSGIVSEIASASMQQTSGIEQVNQAVAQMDEITQQNAALAEQASAASVAMTEQTGTMKNLLGFFQISDATNEVKQSAVKVKPISPRQNPVAAVRAKIPREMESDSAAPLYVDDGTWEEF